MFKAVVMQTLSFQSLFDLLHFHDRHDWVVVDSFFATSLAFSAQPTIDRRHGQ